MKYVKYTLNPEQDFNVMFTVEGFSGTLIYDGDNRLYYGSYPDDADLSSLPDWVIEITEEEFNAVQADMEARAAARRAEMIERLVNDKINEKYDPVRIHEDSSYAKHSVVQLCADGRTVDDVIGHCIAAINDADDLDSLNAIDVDSLDFSAHVPEGSTVGDRIQAYYKDVTRSIIVYRKRRALKAWAEENITDDPIMEPVEWPEI